MIAPTVPGAFESMIFLFTGWDMYTLVPWKVYFLYKEYYAYRDLLGDSIRDLFIPKRWMLDVGGHQQPLKGSRKLTIPKRSPAELPGTWRIIPISKWLGSPPLYTSHGFPPFRRGPTTRILTGTYDHHGMLIYH